jgi:hypothetical protein
MALAVCMLMIATTTDGTVAAAAAVFSILCVVLSLFWVTSLRYDTNNTNKENHHV